MPTSRRTSGAPGARLALLGACFLFGLYAEPAVAFDPESLLQALAPDGRREIGFEERRFLSALSEPVVSRGRFVFEPPDRLIKMVEEPRRESAVIEDDRLALFDDRNREIASIDLSMQPDLRLIFGSVKAILKGDVGALRSAFWISLEGSESEWRLKLDPKVDQASTRLEGIAVTGRANEIESLEVVKNNGDRHLIRFRSGTLGQ